MKGFIKSKKGIALLATLVVLAAAAVGAYAYFTATGTGSGTATVGSTANDIYVTAATTGTVYPDGTSHTLTFTAYNYSTFAQSISSIHATGVAACEDAWTTPDLTAYPPVAPVCNDAGDALTSDGNCVTSLSTGATNDTSDAFWIPDVTVNPVQDLGNGSATSPSGATVNTTGTITMNDTTANQDACQGKNLELTFTTG
jgi:hypothetical protein